MAQAKPAAAEPAGEKVQVYLYDLSQGAAAMLSQGLLGKKIDGIWHTGLVVFGVEYYYGGGIQWAKPGQTMAGRPMRIIDIGETHIGQDMFHEFLQSISPRFTPATYSLLKHNCNNFSNECSQFLTGKPIPEYITGLPEEALNTPMGQMFKPMIEQMESQMRNSQGNGFIPWSEGGALSLPPIRKGGGGGGGGGGAALAGVPVVAAGAAAAVGGAAAAAAAPAKAVDAKAAAAAAAGPAGSPGAPSPAAVSGANAAKHAHYALGCTCVSTQSRAQLAAAESHCATFLALIKQANKKVPAAAQLSEEQLKALADATAALGPAQGDAKDAKAADKEKEKAAAAAALTPISAAAMAAFDVMLLNWGNKQLFGTLGLFRLAVLRPEVAAYYADKCYPAAAGAAKAGDAKAAANAAPATAGHVLAKVLAVLPKAADKKDAAAAAADAPAAAVQIMALCTASNLFSAAALCPKLAADPTVIATALYTARASSEKTIRVAAATLLYNCALFVPKTADGDSAIELVSALAEMVQNEREPEPSALLLLALAHLVFGNSSLAVILHAMDVDLSAVRSRFAGSAQGVSGARIAALTADLQKIVAYEKQQQS